MLIVSANVNGIRAAARRGGVTWLAGSGADVITLQEVRADADQLAAALSDTALASWHVAHAPSEAKGRAGVAVLSRLEPIAVRDDLHAEFAGTGRWVEVDLPMASGAEVVTVASTYVHTGQAGTPRQAEKERFLCAIGERLSRWAQEGRYAVVTGDLNVAHTADDLKNWKGNRGKAGYLPQEQAHLAAWGAEHGFVDVTRHLDGAGPGPYTWWSWRGQAFDNDSGWRIDYQFASRALAQRAVSAEIGKAAAYDQRWSDHAKVSVTYEV
ncbi:MAG: exodeoxyribonuclease III [Ornithinibacter sp.]